MEELHKLEAVDIGESRSSVSRLQRRLAAGRDPGLLADLVDGYFAKGSKRVLKILTSLKGVQSQDLFDKLNECIHRRSTRLAVLRLLAHTLNTQTSWMYKIVDHPLFQAILYFLKTSGDVVVLVSGVLVVVAILPLVPSHLPRHQPDLFEIFTELATIRQTSRLGLTPQELYLHLDLAVYHLFLQLYAMLPCSLFQYLRARYGPTGGVEEFQEYIGPLFHQVQMHPSLVTDAPSYEASKAKWGSMEPHEIATLSLSMCLDPAIAPQEEDPGPPVPKHDSLKPRDGPSSAARKLKLPASDVDQPSISIQMRSSPDSSGATPTSVRRMSPPPVLLQSPANPAGLKSAQELSEFWSPSVTFGQVTPDKLSRDSSRHSMVSHSGHNTSTFSSPRSDSATSSVQHTPGPANTTGPVFTFKNYSPTASVEGEALHSRQLSSLTQSAIHTPSHHEEPFPGTHYEAMSQSMRTDPSHHSGVASRGPTSPIKVANRSTSESQQLNQSLKVKFEKLIGIFSPRKRTNTLNSQSSEEFTEIFMPEHERAKLDRRMAEVDAELGEDCLAGEQPLLPSRPGERYQEMHLDLSRESNDFESGNEADGIVSMDGDTTTPCVGFDLPEDQLELGLHRDSRRFSHNGAVERAPGSAKGEADPPKEPRYSSSFPGQPPTRTRSRNTNSEPTTTHTVHLVQARLQRLVESSQTIAEGETELEERTRKHPPLYATDSTATLLASSPPIGESSRLLMRRVSVCKGMVAGEIGGRLETIESQSHPSPAVLLDQFVSHGEILHRGSAQDIPLTELEGVDWGFFGGCPHSEELGVMQSQVALLHSQLLFERYQCLQHARRNRRLLSKARSGLQLREELVSLREQVQGLQSVNCSLQEEQQKKAVQERGGARAGTWENSSVVVAAENARLRDANFRLAEEVQVLTQQNEKLSKELRGANERVFTLESERAHLQPQLAQARDLQLEVAFLTQQLQVTGELLYQQQQEGGVALLDQGGREKQWELLHQNLLKEKEVAECSVVSLQSELQCLQGQLLELQSQLVTKEQEVASLQAALGLLQGNCREKIRATEEKYEAMCLISQQLESHVMELRGRAALRRKPHHRHKRSSSHPTGHSSHTPSTSATNTPSPISLLSQQHSPS